MILHIPHSSTNIEHIKIKKESDNINLLTDLYTDELFSYKDATSIVFPYNRMVVDVERFKDDPMEKHGKGYKYKTDFFGNTIKRGPNLIFESLYDGYHRKFNDIVRTYLTYFPIAFIVDCHSFPNESFPWEKKSVNRPDICIGTSEHHTPVEVTDSLVKYFSNYGLKTEINNPYNGTIIPSDFVNVSDEVKSIMIEINRSLYLDYKYNKNDMFNDIKNMINGALRIIDEWTNETTEGFWGSLQ